MNASISRMGKKRTNGARKRKKRGRRRCRKKNERREKREVKVPNLYGTFLFLVSALFSARKRGEEKEKGGFGTCHTSFGRKKRKGARRAE